MPDTGEGGYDNPSFYIPPAPPEEGLEPSFADTNSVDSAPLSQEKPGFLQSAEDRFIARRAETAKKKGYDSVEAYNQRLAEEQKREKAVSLALEGKKIVEVAGAGDKQVEIYVDDEVLDSNGNSVTDPAERADRQLENARNLRRDHMLADAIAITHDPDIAEKSVNEVIRKLWLNQAHRETVQQEIREEIRERGSDPDDPNIALDIEQRVRARMDSDEQEFAEKYKQNAVYSVFEGVEILTEQIDFGTFMDLLLGNSVGEGSYAKKDHFKGEKKDLEQTPASLLDSLKSKVGARNYLIDACKSAGLDKKEVIDAMDQPDSSTFVALLQSLNQPGSNPAALRTFVSVLYVSTGNSDSLRLIKNNIDEQSKQLMSEFVTKMNDPLTFGQITRKPNN